MNPVRYFARLSPQIRWLVIGTGVNNLGNLIGPFLTVVIVSKFGVSAGKGGLIVSAFGLGGVFSVIAGGYLTDRFGRRNTLLLSLLGGGFLAIVLGMLSTLGFFLEMLFLFGLINELFRPASLALLADLVPGQDRVMVLTVLRIAANIGITTSMFLGGVFLDWNWRYLFWFDGVTTVLFGLIVMRLIQEPIAHEKGQVGSSVDPSSRSPWLDPVFAAFLVASLFFGAVYMNHLTALPLVVTKTAGLSSQKLGFLLGMSSLIAVAFEFSLTRILLRYRPMGVVSLGTTAVAAGLAASGIFLNWGWFLLMMLVWTLGEMMTFSRLMAFVAEYAPVERRGAYTAAWQATWRVSTILSPLIFLPLYERVPITVLSAAIAAIAAPAILIFLFLYWKCERRSRNVLVGAGTSP